MGTCPTLATGNATVNGQSVELWIGTRNSDAGAPVLFYWHGTGSTAMEAQALMSAQIKEIVSEGGIVASFNSTTGTGMNVTNGTFFTDDFNTADQVLACAVQQLNIDTRRVYAAGCNVGGLQAGAMAYYRSTYLAAVMPNSGGILPFVTNALQGSRVPSVITTHGAPGTDVVGVDFSMTSLVEDMDIKSKGGFAVDCDHDGGTCAAPADDIAAQWKFCKEHPFGVSPEPYDGGLPSSFPSYCVIQ
jgi:poly(3-hydroxybutyrate) depolymerase